MYITGLINMFNCFITMLFDFADAHYMYGFENCQFSSEDEHESMFFGYVYYNKQLIVSYNSTEGKFTSYTEKTKEIVNGLNKNQHLLNEMKHAHDECKQGWAEARTQKPQVRVFSTKTATSHQPGIIICSAYNFYPKPITLTWLRNGEEVTSEVISTDEMSDGNWLYQKHSYLEYIPTPTDTIECMVEHASLPTPELYKWEYYLESRKNKIIVGTAGLLLGLAFTTIGVIYYKKHTKGMNKVNEKTSRGHILRIELN
uniref:Ig-like domain-containing protein n=1 Tax=Neogobius melanostomus TaxID=47308 RepID=A0A8C6V948_9GOBI